MSKAERTRDFIIEKTAALYNTRGVSGVAVSDIMEATKMAKGALYFHFSDKDELAYSAVDHNLKKLVEKTMAYVNQEVTAKGRLLAFIDFLSDPLNPPMVGGCPMLNFGMECDDTDPVIRARVYETIKGSHQTLRSFVQTGIGNGEFKKSWNAKEFAEKAFAMIEGGTMVTRVSGDIRHMNLLVSLLKKEVEENTL